MLAIVTFLPMLVFVTLHYFACSVKKVAYLFQKDDSSDSTPHNLTFIFVTNSSGGSVGYHFRP
ncbi:MAG: hypothetical protein AB9903_34545 [Vulcanimicrobiota bacterium]